MAWPAFLGEQFRGFLPVRLRVCVRVFRVPLG